METYDIEKYKFTLEHVIKNVEDIISLTMNTELKNSQEFIEFLDTLNKLSVSY